MGRLHDTLQPDSIAILVEFFGAGRAIAVPTTTGSPNALRFEVLIGIEQTARMVEEFGGENLYLPGLKPRSLLGKPTLAQVKKLSVNQSATEIALRFGVSVRTIYKRREQLRAQHEKREAR